MRTIVLGGYGNFGARICRALAADRTLTIVAAGRHVTAEFRDAEMTVAMIDIAAPDFESALRTLDPGLVIHCAGPFQGQDYRVARASLACGAHYIDLSDGREFVAGFAPAFDETAQRAHRLAVTGASTLPALSSAVVDAFAAMLTMVYLMVATPLPLI